ncbi:hypothetical protein F503_08221 [Ophiostoma piceae UAMH 11346]|uniref:Uncharacterized protein n=1 Tax=Ophiostoma piceae (strain UAMH 11346) TaxID=1262450 RepID=S3CXW2_OPHP1|nr:hypothetical protein F503_08221 [Ophiostoma piceae UAMH 11346]
MAGLPRQFPDLAIHLTDQARTPIITSSAAEDPSIQQQEPSLAIVDDSVSPTSHAVGPQILPRPTRQQRAQALDDLTATALRARDAAARLGLGADLPSVGQDLDGPEASTAALIAALGMTPPEHLVVTYNTGAVVIESFLDDRSGNSDTSQNKDSDRVNGLGNRDSQAPLLVGVVAAPDAQSLGDARRATARLERVGRQVQQELVAQQRR